MQLSLKYINRWLWIVLLVGNMISCQSWREEIAVMEEAERLLVKGEIGGYKGVGENYQ